MKKFNNILVCGLAAACLLTGAMSLSGCKKEEPKPITVITEEGIELSRYKDETSWTVSSFSQSAKTITIPDEYNKMPVVKIANDAKISAATTTVTIGKNIEILSPDLFLDSVNLTRLDYNAVNAQVSNIPNNEITPIFSGKTGSESDGFVLNIGVEVKQIPDYFMVTTQTINDVFNNGVLRPLYIAPNLVEINFLEDSVLNTIGAYSFIGCNKINQTLELPSSLETISAYAFAFSGVNGVLNLDGSISEVNSYAFWNSSITQIIFNKGVSNISDSAFDTSMLEKVIVNTCFETADSNFFGDVEVDIIVNNPEIAKFNTIFSMSPNGYANFYITTETPQAELYEVFLSKTTYVDTVTIDGNSYYHYK